MSQKVTEIDLKNIMNDIEIKTQNIIITGIQTGKILNPIPSLELLNGIMKSGADEFEKKVGRPMSYSEMRSMYG
jgi:hypothetical protein